MLVPLMHSLAGGATLAVVGDGPYLAELKTLLPDAIFTGYLLGDVLAAAYASADVFLFPSTTDTYGNVVVEALASGIPCIVSDAGGPAGLVRAGRTGFVFRARDEKDLAARVSLLLDEKGALTEMKQAIAEEYVSSTWNGAAGEFFEELGGPFKR
jgi:glycosyltransferase involved in cell wall biosynthesis